MAGTGRLDRRRQLADRLDGQRQLGADLASLLSPRRQSGPRAVARASVWLAGTGSLDRRRQLARRLYRRRQLADRLDGRRQLGADLACLLSPGRQFGLQAVAGASVWLVGCRRGVSLDGGDRQTRPAATTGAQTLPSATTGGQTLRAATAGGRFGLLTVAGASVWLAGCRRVVSLADGRLVPSTSPPWPSGSALAATPSRHPARTGSFDSARYARSAQDDTWSQRSRSLRSG